MINSNINSNTDLNFNTTTYFEAGKTYYFKYEVSDSSYSFTASLNIHNHNYISTFAKAVADDDRENAIDGYVKYRCSSCGDEYIAQNIFAPVSVSLSSLKVAYNGYENIITLQFMISSAMSFLQVNMLLLMKIIYFAEKLGCM